MEICAMFLVWKKHYCQNDNITHSNLQITQSNSYQISNVIFHRLEFFFFLPSVWKHKKPWVTKAKLRKKKKGGGIRLPNSRLCYKATIIKAVWCWHWNRNIDQWTRIEILGINHHSYGHLLYDNGGKTIQKIKVNLFNKKCWESRQLHVEE